MTHHRFIAQFEIIVEEPGNKDTSPPAPMPAELVADLITEITNKAKPKDKDAQEYNVLSAEKAKKKP